MPGGGVLVDDHVPGHAAGHRRVERAVHADGRRAAARERPGHAAAHAGDAEVVAEHRNAGLADAADDRLAVFEVLALLRAVEQHVVPVGRIEVFDRFELEAGGVDLALERDQLVDGPQLIGIAGQAPASLGAGRLVVARIVRARLEIVDQVDHNMSGPGLPRELEVLRVSMWR